MLPPSPSEEVRSPSGLLSPKSTPKSPGSPYYAYNPDTLDQMKYRDLQSLAKKLNLGGKGTKESLIEKLAAWHTKTIIHQDRCAPIQNLSMVPVLVGGASPRFLSPLKNKAVRNVDGTPRGILTPLKRSHSWLNVQTQIESGMQTVREEGMQTQTEAALAKEEIGETCTKKPRKNISFSVYNGIRLISPRRIEPTQILPFIEPESDPDSLDFTGSSFDSPPKLVDNPEVVQLPKPSAPASCSPLQAVQRIVSLPLRIPSFITSLLSSSSTSSASSTFATASTSSPSFSFAVPPSSVLNAVPPFSLPSDPLVLPYPTCVVSTSQPPLFPTAAVSQSVSVTATTALPTPTSAPLPSLETCVSSSDVVGVYSASSSTPVSALTSSAEELLSTDSSKSPIQQERWSAKERRTRRSSFGEGAADKANRIASGQKPSRLSLPATERSKRRRSSLA